MAALGGAANSIASIGGQLGSTGDLRCSLARIAGVLGRATPLALHGIWELVCRSDRSTRPPPSLPGFWQERVESCPSATAALGGTQALA